MKYLSFHIPFSGIVVMFWSLCTPNILLELYQIIS
nr:MAG TPA: hypothetical protein [Caudoviricetes sp.]